MQRHTQLFQGLFLELEGCHGGVLLSSQYAEKSDGKYRLTGCYMQFTAGFVTCLVRLDNENGFKCY